MATSELEVLLPTPKIHRIAGVELRQAPLSGRRLIAVVKFVEKNIDLLERAKMLGKPKEAGGLSMSELLEEDALKRTAALARLLMPDEANTLTDEWCMEHLGPAHYSVFIKTALVQNELYEVFSMAKGVVAQFVEAALRQAGAEAPTASA